MNTRRLSGSQLLGTWLERPCCPPARARAILQQSRAALGGLGRRAADSIRSVDFPGGSNIKTDDDLGFDFGFGYNFDDHWLVSGEIGWNTVGYAGNLASADTRRPAGAGFPATSTRAPSAPASPTTCSTGRSRPTCSGTLGLDVDRHQHRRRAAGDRLLVGPVVRPDLRAIVNTIGDDSASYGLGIGVRWDFAPGGFVRFGYDERWLDIQNAERDAGLRLVPAGSRRRVARRVSRSAPLDHGADP